MGRVLVTGATGFIGAALAENLFAQGVEVRCAARRTNASLPSGISQTIVRDVASTDDWAAALDNVDAVVHLAGLAHRLHVTDAEQGDYHRVNVLGTAALAAAAGRAGVRRVVLASTIAVNGSTTPGQPFCESSEVAAEGAYALSKLSAETTLRRAAAEYGFEWCILRPPMVYGKDAPGNFDRLTKLVMSGRPMPFGRAVAKKSLISIGNLISATNQSVTHPAAANALFLVSDDEDVSTADLIQYMGRAAGKKPLLLNVPEGAIRFAAGLLGRGSDVDKLFKPLVIDASHIKTALQWTPPFSVREGIEDAFRHMQKS